MKIIAWDLETSNLDASFGTIITAAWKIVGEKKKPKCITIHDYKGDILQAEKKLIVDLREALLDGDCWLTWYGTYFDIPYLNSRLLYHKLSVVPGNFTHIDGWKTARNRLKLHSNRLNSVQQFLGLEDEKTNLKGAMWLKSLAGDSKAMAYLKEHNIADVLVLEQAYERLKPLILDHPLFDGRGECGVCGEGKLQKRGIHRTRTRMYQRYQCQECGSWSKGKKPIKETK